ncbi:MAG: hypothetical protein ABI977_13950 [Acidobacteriota bacterium]
MKHIEEFGKLFKKESKVCQFTIDGTEYRLVRINDSLYYEACRNSVAIMEDHGLYLDLWFSQRQSGKGLNLAETYVALKLLLGESSNSFDDWKCSFSFPCLLQIKKPHGESAYAVHMFDMKGGLELYFRKLLDAGDKRFDRMVMQQPLADEFSRAEINKFIAFFYGYLEGYLSAVRKDFDEWFFRTIRAQGIIYGYQQGQFFAHSYDSEKDFDEAIETVRMMQKLALGKN